MSDIYPLNLYRDGTGFIWDGRPTDSMIVFDSAAHDAALDGGFVEAEAYWDSEPPSASAGSPDLLDGTAKDIAEALPALGLDELEKYRAAEVAGKSRVGVLKMLDAAIDEKLKG